MLLLKGWDGIVCGRDSMQMAGPLHLSFLCFPPANEVYDEVYVRIDLI